MTLLRFSSSMKHFRNSNLTQSSLTRITVLKKGDGLVKIYGWILVSLAVSSWLGFGRSRHLPLCKHPCWERVDLLQRLRSPWLSSLGSCKSRIACRCSSVKHFTLFTLPVSSASTIPVTLTAEGGRRKAGGRFSGLKT